MKIKRHLFDTLRQKLLQDSKIVILYGARQVGKTTLIRTLIGELGLKTLQISGDDIRYADLLSSRNTDRLKLLAEGNELLFIDEAQRIPDIGLNLKLLHDQFPGLKIIVTGSSSFELANRTKEPLTGRTWTYQLYPVSVQELQSVYSRLEIENKAGELLVFGSYPQLLQYGGMQEKKEYLKELCASYLYKDILELSNIRHSDKITGLLRLLAFQIGSEVSPHELAQGLGLSKETVSHYLDLLEKSFVIFRLHAYSRNLRKEISKMQKIYFWDLGVRNAIINNLNLLENRDDTGKLWENFIVAERLKFNSNRRFLAAPYFWRIYTGAEIDYVEENDGVLSGYEIKYKEKKARIPKTWQETYPKSSFSQIHSGNYFEFLT